MNIELFMKASEVPILSNWILDKSTSEIAWALDVVKTPHFKNWHASHPKGTMDEYIYYCEQQQAAYYNSTGYLEDEIENLNGKIEELNEEIQEKDENIDYLVNCLNFQKTVSVSAILVSLIIFLYSIRRSLARLFRKIFKKK